jgi:hypothetical protein
MNVAVHRCWISAAAVAILSHGGTAAAQPSTDGLQTYSAVYGLFEGAKRIGRTEISLTYDSSNGHYVYESRSSFLGFLLRLAAPHPVIERSEFRVERGRVRPLSYRYEDGTRRGRRNLSLEFRWADAVLAVRGRDQQTDVPLPPRALDRASVKVALGFALRDGRRAGRHAVADPDEFRTYEFQSTGAEKLSTPIGEIDAIPVTQSRAESSRQTTVWIAPTLGYQAARIEQHRPDRDPVAFSLEAFEWTASESAAFDSR